MASPEAVTRLVGQLGSTIPPPQVDGYVRLLQSTKHISAALGMMANWDLKAFASRLPALAVPLELVVCDNDRAVPVRQAQQLIARLPGARLHRLPGLGHLGHEEDPGRVYELLGRLGREAGVDL
jgi:magnesium chelatase accessory protein